MLGYHLIVHPLITIVPPFVSRRGVAASLNLKRDPLVGAICIATEHVCAFFVAVVSISFGIRNIATMSPNTVFYGRPAPFAVTAPTHRPTPHHHRALSLRGVILVDILGLPLGAIVINVVGGLIIIIIIRFGIN